MTENYGESWHLWVFSMSELYCKTNFCKIWTLLCYVSLIFILRVSVPTYITPEVSLGPCISPFLRFGHTCVMYHFFSLKVSVSTYITQEVSLGPCIAPYKICTKFSLNVSVSTYITQEVSLGSCIAPFVKFVQS